MDDAILMRLIKKTGYKTVTDFYRELAEERLDVNDIIEKYLEMGKEKEETFETRTAEEYVLTSETKEDELVIGSNLKGVVILYPNVAILFMEMIFSVLCLSRVP